MSPPKKPFSGPPSRQVYECTLPPTYTPDQVQGARSGIVRYRVDDLMKGGREATLIHRGQEYRLRITSMGKLILTK